MRTKHDGVTVISDGLPDRKLVEKAMALMAETENERRREDAA